MSSRSAGHRGENYLLALSAVFIFCLPAAAQTQGACPADLSGYTVSAIKVHTSFGFSGEAKKRIAEALGSSSLQPKVQPPAPQRAERAARRRRDAADADPQAGLKVNGPYSTTAENATLEALRRLATPRRGAARVQGPLVLPILVFSRVKACDTGARTLEVHYYAYSADYRTYLSSLLVAEEDALNRAAPATPLTRFVAATNPQPFVGFNRSRGVFGGGSLRMEFDGPVVNKIEAGASGSASSAEAGAAFSGSRESDSRLMARAEWKAGYKYSNVPSSSNDLKEGAGYGQFIGATRPAGRLGFVARYGAAVEAGNKQTDLNPSLAPPGILTASRFNSLKVFVGGVAQAGGHSFEASYGLEAGNARAGLAVDYLKHVFDAGYAARFVPFKRRPITLDARLGAGSIDRRGDVPLAARFFGGNVERNFIPSSDWVIRSDPFARSFPQNRLLPVGQTVATGGDKFISFNLTAAATVWGRPLVPPEVSESADFDNALKSELTVADVLLREQFFIEQAEPLKKFARDRLTLTSDINLLLRALEGLKDVAGTSAEARLRYEDAVEDACWAAFALNEVALSLADASGVQKVCERKALGDGRTLIWLDALLLSNRVEPHPPVRPVLHNLSCDLLLLADELGKVGAAPEKIAGLKSAAQKIEEHRINACAYSCLKEGSTAPAQFDVGLDFGSCAADSETGTGPLCPNACSAYVGAQDAAEVASARERAERKARETVEYSERLITRLAKEENLIAFGPVFMLDAARIAERPQSLADAPTRYGVGAGARFSLVNIDFTLGYSFNARRRANEPRGAMVFFINVSDLLR